QVPCTGHTGYSVVGFSDVWGNDELRVGLTDGPYVRSNPINIDNLKVELGPEAVPIPASDVLLAASITLAGYLGRRRRTAAVKA
ncbi:MAG: hypothetical protein ACKVGZ_13910, partial [Alphaproteobacteria bacterium]